MHPIGKPAHNACDLTGQQFGRLRVLSKTESKKFSCGSTQAQWLCVCECGRVCVVLAQNLRSGNSRSCGCLQVEMAQNKKGPHGEGRQLTKQGYVKLYVEDGDRRYLRNPDSRYELEHVLVMSRSLRRPLLPEETVHHKNGERSDNRLDNLELWSSAHPPGQRVEDKVKWAREILSLYGNTDIGSGSSRS
jgi:hypothetical protein